MSFLGLGINIILIKRAGSITSFSIQWKGVTVRLQWMWGCNVRLVLLLLKCLENFTDKSTVFVKSKISGVGLKIMTPD